MVKNKHQTWQKGYNLLTVGLQIIGIDRIKKWDAVIYLVRRIRIKQETVEVNKGFDRYKR